jgi:hypothetical protein
MRPKDEELCVPVIAWHVFDGLSAMKALLSL